MTYDMQKLCFNPLLREPLPKSFSSSFFLFLFFQFLLTILFVIISFIIFIQLMQQPSQTQHTPPPHSFHNLQTPLQQHSSNHSQKRPKTITKYAFPHKTAKKDGPLELDQSSEAEEKDDEGIWINDEEKRVKKNNKMKLKRGQKEQNQLIQDQEKSKQGTGESSQANLFPQPSIINNNPPQTTPCKSTPTKKLPPPRFKKPRSLYKYDKNQDSLSIQQYQFTFTNNYVEKHSDIYLSTEQAIQKAKRQLRDPGAPGTFLNCDVRYFNWELFVSEVGKFDVLIIDPPWRIKGAQQNDSQFMFSNCKFSLEYNTMGNSQIARIPLHLISDEGFIFLWILNSQMDTSIEIMQTWGYELVDEITWVKLRDGKIYLTHGYYFMHSYEVCLVGYKGKKQPKSQEGPSDSSDSSSKDRLKMRGSLMNNTMFAQVRKKSQKPQDLYTIIQMMFPGKRTVQIFARNHNLRFGLFSIGNQLGESYQKWNLNLNCDNCSGLIEFGTKRYKSKLRPNYDLCHKCIQNEKRQEFFEISNEVDEDIRHEYVTCNMCEVEPIWGIRFQCVTCQDFDICENCYDKNLTMEEKAHPVEHEFRLLEIPVFGNGFQVNDVRCFSCYQNPIIGIYFNCMNCKNFKQCQKCYFQRPKTDSTSRNHKPDHQMEVIFQPQLDQNKKYQCFACKVQILQDCHMCENCYNFFFCSKCYEKKESFKSLYANSHKKYHVFTKIF